ncbi:unnamed protein product [Brassica rapa subsp. trilocularis]
MDQAQQLYLSKGEIKEGLGFLVHQGNHQRRRLKRRTSIGGIASKHGSRCVEIKLTCHELKNKEQLAETMSIYVQ